MIEATTTRGAEAEALTALPPSLGATVGYVLHRAFLQVQQGYVAALTPRHPRDLTIIARLLAAGPCSQQELGECLTVNRSAMVHVIDELEREGLVSRQRNASDRRSYALTATSAGVALLEALTPALLGADREATRRLANEDRARLQELLARLLGSELAAVAAPVDETTGYLVARAHFQLHKRADETCEPFGLEVREYGTLATIDDLAPCSQQQVATMLGVSGPVVVELIDALEPRGLVVRERNPSDRRSYALRLGESGAALRDRAAAALNAREDETRRRVGVGEYGELCQLLRRLVGAEPASAGA
jgi:DNA-binding MarR family transcriptional regulator